jgi:hypothetical protein
MSDIPHLWEADHSYYCNEGNYYSGECGTEWKSWAEFLAEFGASDMDYNLVFRWDWKEGEDEGATTFNGDVNYRNGRLLIFFMGQRKGLFFWHDIQVCRADEPAVIEFLRPRLAHLISLWEPLHPLRESAKETP